MAKDNLLRISMQHFAAPVSDSAGTENAGTETDDKNEKQTESATENTDSGKKSETSDLDKYVQSQVDKKTAESGKKIAALQKELETLKKEKMTADELKQHEISAKEQELAEREKTITDMENRMFAIKAIKEAGLDDGDGKSLELVDFVIADSEDEISNKVKAFGDLVKRFVKAEVDKTFKKNGRNPNSGSSAEDKNKSDGSVAEKLGKARAEKQKQSNDILKLYSGR